MAVFQTPRIQIKCTYLLIISGDIGNYYYRQRHPMKPHRIRMTHNLLLNYGLLRKMEMYRRHPQGDAKNFTVMITFASSGAFVPIT